jgi:hypothetical protein
MLQLVVVAISLLGLYRQVRLQTSASAIEQAESLSSTWSSERMSRSTLAVLLYLRESKDWTSVPKQPSNVIGNFWERVGYLVRKGHIRGDIVSAYLGSAARLWWIFLGPYTRELRELHGDPSIYEHFEWLAGTMAALDRKAGNDIGFDDATIAQRMEYFIQVSREAVRAEEDLRAVRTVSQQARDAVGSVRSGDIRRR